MGVLPLCGLELGSVRLFRLLSVLGSGWSPCFARLLRSEQGRLMSWPLSQKSWVSSAEVPYGMEVPSHCQSTSHTDLGLGSGSVGIPGTELFVCICPSVACAVHCQGRAEWKIDWPGEPHTPSSSARSLMGILFTWTCSCLIMGGAVRAGVWRQGPWVMHLGARGQAGAGGVLGGWRISVALVSVGIFILCVVGSH